ncbi:cupin domain-containing protein [Xylaria bambusicola]|uniref:cupin domain-containing protein n=1 Tax=Xylaria bambusicola TaxID=326684 RepID=UPI0020071E46|nr:cupin domain-containing protein [Xylaria bambusicola]KAI0512987.1 cupin domain-containing protein [Xylaria bambusicola]
MSIFSLLPDILPMIMPSAITVVKATDLETQREKSKDSPMIRQGAIIGKSDRMCATGKCAADLTTMYPACSPQNAPLMSACSDAGEAALFVGKTIIYAASGKGILVTNKGDQLKRHELSAGDFVFVPPWTEHQELNETDEEVVWILIRSGPEPVVVYLTGWDGDRVKADTD